MRISLVHRLVALSIVAAAAAHAQGRPLTVEDYYRVKTVGAPHLSPDGRWVAFTVGTRHEANNADSSEVWLVASDGSAAARRVSLAGSHGTGPVWADAERLTFSAGGRRWSLSPAQPDSLT
ncbi:MAG: hypothetical protein ACRENU_02125, partial [Gemmatimonadaceae bacterium]